MDNHSVSDDNSEPDYYALSSGRLTRTNTDMGCSTPGGNSINYSRTISSVSAYSELNEEHNSCYDPPVGWPISKIVGRGSPKLSRLSMKKNVDVMNRKSDSEQTLISEMEMMKERFAKLLLGEDMSGGGKGVCSAVAISNAITNLYATMFGHLYKLEPLPPEKKTMWRREMDCLLSICDSIIEFVPSTQNLPDGTTLDVMTTRPRADIYLNLPALQKLDDMLIETLESFEKTEFWYVEEGKKAASATSKSFRKLIVERSEDKWWLPVPCVPPTGLSEKARKELQQKRDCVHQIHKAAMAINNSILGEMEVPESYMATLPKSGKLSVGESIYHYMSTPEQFSPDYLLDCLDITSEHVALEVADRVEAAMYVWRRKARMHASKSTWDMVKDLVADENKNKILASRAEDLLLCLKQRYPGLSQTTLDTAKIQCNKDVGQGILESYSRVLESLAFNVVAWIDDVLFVDACVRKQRKP